MDPIRAKPVIVAVIGTIFASIFLGLTVLLFSSMQYDQYYSANALSLIGERFFENGTGIAYFDDGTTQGFHHTITPRKGYYYDNSTIFYAGNIPGISNVSNITTTTIDSGGGGDKRGCAQLTQALQDLFECDTGGERGSAATGKIVNVTIAYGAEFLGNKTLQPSIVKINVGDTVVWTNEDWSVHDLLSPPGTSDPKVPAGMNFHSATFPQGTTFSHTFTKPGGFHYNDFGNEEIVGTIIVMPSEQAAQEKEKAGGNHTTTSGNTTTTRTTGANATTNTTTGRDNTARITGATTVSIIPGSSSLGNFAFQPNPVQVQVGGIVTWTNDDTQPHTVVSGANAQPDGKFDSSPNFNPLLAPGETFEHTFTEAGQYPYYCALHPNMVGTVNVS
jgi:plastocyanin